MHLLPNQPRPVVDPRQADLTRRILQPHLPELHEFFLEARTYLDKPLSRRRPTKSGKPYPLGQCLEISLAVQNFLPRIQPAWLGAAALEGHAAYQRFRQAGGLFRQVWGDLRGEFFQNAFQLGTLYVDVSNDTVNPAKPKVEILPFEQANFRAIEDFAHFARLAQRYWQHTVYPNHLLPELAPYCPQIHLHLNGAVTLRDPTKYMVALARSSRFGVSEAYLRSPAMPQPLFDTLRAALHAQGWGDGLPTSPEQGRTQALAACQDYRRRRWYANPRESARVLVQVRQVNRMLLAATSTAKLRLPMLHPPAVGEA